MTTPHVAERAAEVTHWLLDAAPNAAQAQQDWTTMGMALLRCGDPFTAVRLSGDLVHAAAETRIPAEVDDFLAHTLAGPVIASAGLTRYYVLMEGGPSRHIPGTESLLPGTLLGVPAAVRTRYQLAIDYWAVPMNSPGQLCPADRVAQLARNGAAALHDNAEGELEPLP